MKCMMAFACLLAVAFASTVKSDDTEAAELYYPYYYPAMNGVAINGLGVQGLGINGLGYSHRRWARSVGVEETDVAQKDTNAADQYFIYWNGRKIPLCINQGRRWKRGSRYC